jgi:hypothetical protein
MRKVLIVLSFLFFLAACAPLGGTGRAVFTITDAAANMDSVSSVKIRVDSVQVHSSAEGWTTVSSSPQTYDLLKLKTDGSQALLADVTLKEGNYQQVRLLISNVEVTDSTGTHDAKLPSGDLKIVGDLKVAANTTAVVKFDFIVDESLHVTGNGQYILAPVVRLETREAADVDTSVKAKVKVGDGKVKTDIKVGMNERGEVGIGLQIRQDLNLTIDNQGNIKIGGLVSSKAKTQGESKQNASAEANASVKVTV